MNLQPGLSKGLNEGKLLSSDRWIRALTDGNWRVRVVAAEQLADEHGSRAVEALCRSVSNEEWVTAVREAAAHSLGRIGDPRAILPLCAALRETGSPSLRRTAAQALAQVLHHPDRHHLPLPAQVLADSRLTLAERASCLQSMASAADADVRLPARDAADYCRSLLEDEGTDLEVRRAAREVLDYVSGAALLRPAEAPDRDTLLRPACPVQDLAAERLLRSAGPDAAGLSSSEGAAGPAEGSASE